jgi:hypothetical protein
MPEPFNTFFKDVSSQLIVLLIFLNLALGIAAALATGKFLFSKVADFYRAKVLPFLICYCAWYIAVQFGAVQLFTEVLGKDVGQALTNALTYAGALTVIANLLGDIYHNLQDLGIPLPKLPGMGSQDTGGEAGTIGSIIASVPAPSQSSTFTITRDSGPQTFGLYVPTRKGEQPDGDPE